MTHWYGAMSSSCNRMSQPKAWPRTVRGRCKPRRVPLCRPVRTTRDPGRLGCWGKVGNLAETSMQQPLPCAGESTFLSIGYGRREIELAVPCMRPMPFRREPRRARATRSPRLAAKRSLQCTIAAEPPGGLSMFSLLLAAALFPPPPKPAKPTVLLVHEGGLGFLDPAGREVEKVDPTIGNGTLSPDGRWLACLQGVTGERLSRMVLRPRGHDAPVVVVPEIGIAPGEGCLPVWSADNKRLFVGEHRKPGGGMDERRYRIYDLTTPELGEVKLPEGFWVSDWSRDGKRLLGYHNEGGSTRLAWVNTDGSGKPEYVTPDTETAFSPRLSPDGRKILYLSLQKRDEEESRTRLTVLDLTTKKSLPIDEPGKVDGHCWSPTGSRVAYTWQRSLGKREHAPERET